MIITKTHKKPGHPPGRKKNILFQRVNLIRLIAAFIIVIFLEGISYLFAMYKGFWLFTILRFPTHTLLWNYFKTSSQLYRIGLWINILFWTLLLERIFMIISVIRKNRGLTGV